MRLPLPVITASPRHRTGSSSYLFFFPFLCLFSLRVFRAFWVGSFPQLLAERDEETGKMCNVVNVSAKSKTRLQLPEMVRACDHRLVWFLLPVCCRRFFF